MKRITILLAATVGALALSAASTVAALGWNGDSISARADCTNGVLVVTGTDAANGFHFGSGQGHLVFSNGNQYP
jgi:hypothetical protein